MTMTLEVPEEVALNLKRVAERNQVSGEVLALQVLSEYVEREEHRRAVKEAGDYVQRKNAELYRRLA